jgi:hypothetical protein
MFPILKEKKFTDLANGTVVSVIDQFENIAILDSGQRVDVKRLMDKAYFDDYIDPKNFFGETFNVFAEKIKSVDLSQIRDEEPVNDSAIIEVDPEQERREMEQKALRMAQQMNPGAAAQKQVDMLREILGDDEDLPQVSTEPQTTVVVNNQPQVPVSKSHTQPVTKVVDDPIITMFKNVKRNQNFNFTLLVDGKIPRLDFIEMMEDSYTTSIIEFLANEFTQNLLSDPDFIKNKIMDEIKSLVYGKTQESEPETEYQIINDIAETPLEQINDGSSSIKPKRAPRKSTKKSTQQ